MTKVLVGSENPVKISSVKNAFEKYSDKVKVTGINVNSRVSNQPVNEETFEGGPKSCAGPFARGGLARRTSRHKI